MEALEWTSVAGDLADLWQCCVRSTLNFGLPSGGASRRISSASAGSRVPAADACGLCWDDDHRQSVEMIEAYTRTPTPSGLAGGPPETVGRRQSG